MIAIGKDFRLVGQIGAAAVHQIEAGQAVLLRDLLRAQMLFHRDGKIGAALHGGVIGDDHRLAAHHTADAGDQCLRRALRCHKARLPPAGRFPETASPHPAGD